MRNKESRTLGRAGAIALLAAALIALATLCIQAFPATAYADVVQIPAAEANDASNKTDRYMDTDRAGVIDSYWVPYKVGGNTYSITHGFYIHDNVDDFGSFYYSDGLFYEDPYTYNTHMAPLSWAYAVAASYLNQDATPIDRNVYYNKHAGGRQFLADIGCLDQDIYVNDFNLVKPTMDTIGVTIGSKELRYASTIEGEAGTEGTLTIGEKTGDILIAVAVRSQGYETEWVSNVTLGTVAEMSAKGNEAKGFSSAADKVFAEVENYLVNYDLQDEFLAGHVKFWVVGYSRGGATANLTSKRLVDKIARECPGSGTQVFGYTCEAAKGGTDAAEVPGNNYQCIHNMVNAVDIVPFVAPEQMGFKRYGVDHYIPGTNAGEVKTTTKRVTRGNGSSMTVTTYRDNDIVYTKTQQYDNRKSEMLRQLICMNGATSYEDGFRPYALDFISWSFPFDFEIMNIYPVGYSDVNKVEYFVADFIRFIQEGLDPSELYGKGKVAATRDQYASHPYALDGETHPTTQTTLQDLMQAVQSMSSAQMSGFADAAATIKDYIPTTSHQPSTIDPDPIGFDTIYALIGNWDGANEAHKAAQIKHLWEAFEKTNATRYMNGIDAMKLKSDFPTLINLVFKFLDGDYNYKPGKHNNGSGWAEGSSETMMYIATFIKHADYILSCHSFDVNVAWARAYDPAWYSAESASWSQHQFKVVQPESVAAPTASGTVDGESVALEAGEDKTNTLKGNQKIILENGDIVGEAVYYDLYEVRADGYERKIEYNQIYRGGIDLALGSVSARTFVLRTYDMSYGVASEKVTYNITLCDDVHKVVVWDMAEDAPSASGASLGGQAASSDGQTAGAGGQAVNPNGQAASPSGQATGTSGQATGSVDDSLNLVAGTIDLSAGEQSLSGQSTSYQTLPAGYRERTYTFKEGQAAAFKAGVPPSQYFKKWVVQVLDPTGEVVLTEDVAADLLDGDELKTNVNFEMPVASDAYPPGYQLRFIAEYGHRIKTITAMPDIPVVGEDLRIDVEVTFDDEPTRYQYFPAWSEDGTVVPAWEAQSDKVYTATIHINQNEEKGIVFADGVVLQEWPDEYASHVKSWRIEKNPTDGSVTIEVTFNKTEGDDPDPDPPDPGPDQMRQFKIVPYDLNISAPTAPEGYTYSAGPGMSMTLRAPIVPDERIAGWDFNETGITGDATAASMMILARMPDPIPDTWGKEAQYPWGPSDVAVIYAQFKPILNKVEVVLKKADGTEFNPSTDNGVPDHADVYVTISNTYQINPENLKLTWVNDSDDGDGDYLTDHTATVEIVANEDGKYHAKETKTEGGSAVDGVWQEMNFLFFPADNMTATFNGDGNDVSYDLDERWVSKVFPSKKYTLKSVDRPADITGLPHGTTEDDINQLLPMSTTIETTNDLTFDVHIKWTAIEDISGGDDPLAKKTWKATGEVVLPDYVENPEGDAKVDLAVSLEAYVDAAPRAEEPVATRPSGTYYGNQLVALRVVQDGVSVWFRTNGASDWIQDDGGYFYINRSMAVPQTIDGIPRLAVTIEAQARADDMYPSDIVTYTYVFEDVIAPTGKELYRNGAPQIGVASDLFYVLEPISDGVTIDEGGNAVASEPGTYQVRAKLETQGDWWAADSAGDRTQEDKVITFTINQAYAVTTSAEPSAGGTTTGDGYYIPGSEVEVSATPSDGYVFVNWTEGDTVASTAATYAFTAEADRALTANFAQIMTVRWLNGDGSELDKKEYLEGQDEPTTDKVPTKAATDQHFYIFEKWDEGETDGAVKTYRPIFTETPIPVPSEKATLTFNCNGGTLNGKATFTIEAAVGDTITIPDAPVRDGYTFAYWQGSRYSPGDKYTVEGDHAFSAVWEKRGGVTPASGKTAQGGTVGSTGDSVASGLVAALAGLAVVSLATALLVSRHRRKKQD